MVYACRTIYMEAGITATDIEEAHYIMLISPTVECQKWSNVEEIGVEEILVSKEVEFSDIIPQWHLGNLI